jgi:hypothetical protein
MGATEITFSTAPVLEEPTAGPPADRLAAAYKSLTADPPRVGDALADLSGLPEPLASSDLALRLKLVAFGHLGLANEFEAVRARLAGGGGALPTEPISARQ